MEVLLTRRLGRLFCGILLCSLVSFANGEDDGGIVFIDDQDTQATSDASNGSFIVVDEVPLEKKQPQSNTAWTNQLSLRSETQAKRAPKQFKSQQAAPKNSQKIVRSVAKPKQLDKAGQLLVEAHNASATAKTETELSEVIDKCVAALRLGVKGETKQFTTELISWSLNRRGQVYTDAGKQELADADFEEAIHFDPLNWRALHNRGVSHAEAGSFAEAFDDFSRVIEMNPKFAKAYTNRATLFVQAGDLVNAERDYQLAYKLDRKLASACLGLARIFHMQSRWNEALEHFTQASKIEPENPGILCSRGDLLADMGQYADALSSYARAIELKPSYGHAYRNGAWLLATCPDDRFRDSENAIRGAQQAIESEYGERHVALDTLAAALASGGKFEKAIETLEEAIELAPETLRADYIARVKLYEAGEPFRTQPVADVSQAVYEESDGE